MRKNRKTEDHDNPDRWVVSYADFITLLFAFFTTLYAISHVDLGKLERFTGSMQSAFKTKQRNAIDTTVIDGIRPPVYADVRLEKELREEIGKSGIIEGVVVSRDDRGVIVSFEDALLFESNEAALKKSARPIIAIVAAAVRKAGRTVVIEGHTDNLPLRNSRYSSNMELSAARSASTFAALLSEDPGAQDRISTAGYGEYRPIASNATFEGRARNRRIDIIFVSRKDGT